MAKLHTLQTGTTLLQPLSFGPYVTIIDSFHYILRSLANIVGILYVLTAFGQAKSDSQSVASRQQALTATYERLLQAAEVLTK